MNSATIDVAVLRDACTFLAREVLLERTETLSDRARELAAEFEGIAREELLEQLEAGRDPNLIVRIVQFLAQSTSSPPFEPYNQWFFGVVLVLMELACPTAEAVARCGELYADIAAGHLLASRGVVPMPAARET
jgi:hypothetical protein